MGTIPGRPLPGQPARRWAGPLPTQGRGMGRRTRSSPSGGKLRTWRRGPVSQQRKSGRSGGYVGEYRRSGNRPLSGGTTGTEDPNQAVPGVWQTTGRPTWGLRRARCGESRTAGSGSGPGKRAGRKTGTAPRTDFTTCSGRIEPSSCAPPRPESPVPEPVLDRIRRRPILGGLINQYEPAA